MTRLVSLILALVAIAAFAPAPRHAVRDVNLTLTTTAWHPEGDSGASITVAAFAADSTNGSVPGPLLRIAAGTDVHVTVRNTLGKRAVVHGLHDHTARTADSIALAPGESRDVRFRATVPGTYLYWARTTASARPLGRLEDSQLVGAFIVDDPAAAPSDTSKERLAVITVYEDTAFKRASLLNGHALVFAVNGRSWPATERFEYAQGDTVRWRLINASDHVHPMHLHGHYFTVTSHGTILGDTTYALSARRLANTEFLANATSSRVTWTADRPGRWLFHCHMLNHIDRRLRLDTIVTDHEAHGTIENTMAGLVTAITIKPRANVAQSGRAGTPPPLERRRVFVTERAGAMSFVLQQGTRAPSADSVLPLGSLLQLHQGVPTEITVVNRSAHSTAVHWHGMELDSWYDGVAGWSGATGRSAPMIAPGDSFVVRLAPTRAGTFIYHTHMDDGGQLRAGLFAPLVVLPRGARMDSTDRVIVLSDPRAAAGPNVPLGAMNGAVDPPPIELTAGTTHRLRFINIAATLPKRIKLFADTALVTWRRVAKDGADLPAALATEQPANVPIGAGETMDFAFRSVRKGQFVLEVNTNNAEIRRYPMVVH